jgi:hypothetical protein
MGELHGHFTAHGVGVGEANLQLPSGETLIGSYRIDRAGAEQVTMKKDRDDTQHQPPRAPKGGAAQAMCAAQACLSQARPQLRTYSIAKARQQAGEFFIVRGGASRTKAVRFSLGLGVALSADFRNHFTASA